LTTRSRSSKGKPTKSARSPRLPNDALQTGILGVGIYLVETARIGQALTRFGGRFARRILRPEELNQFRSQRDPATYLASRFAAKESVAKALGLGIGRKLSWHDILIGRLPSGQPVASLPERGDSFPPKSGRGYQLHLSLSHTTTHAVAVAILERVPH